jgi:zinc D-Ala-D-Ala carboxypeptidase
MVHYRALFAELLDSSTEDLSAVSSGYPYQGESTDDQFSTDGQPDHEAADDLASGETPADVDDRPAHEDAADEDAAHERAADERADDDRADDDRADYRADERAGAEQAVDERAAAEQAAEDPPAEERSEDDVFGQPRR